MSTARKKLSILLIVFSYISLHAQEKTAIDYVNPYIGTTNNSQTDHYGGVMPVVAPPFAMTQWTAATRENKISSCSYNYKDTIIIGFIGTHQPCVWMGDYGMVTLMPELGKVKTGRNREMYFSHNDESVSPYLYSVKMRTKKKEVIEVKASASMRCGIITFKYPQSDSAQIFIEASRERNFIGWVKIDTMNNEVYGYNPDRQSAHLGPPLPNFKGYFVIRYDKKAKAFGTTFGGAIFQNRSEQYGETCGAYISFSTKEGEEITTKIGTSFISLEQARENLDTEIPNWDIQQVAQQCHSDWNVYMKRIQVEGGTDDQRVNFYTGMYHALQFPRTFSESGRYYSAFDDKIHNGVSYNDYSLWDTYRSLHPLLIFLAPEHVNPMIQSLLQIYKEGGWLPKWPNPTYTNIMIGTHADAVIADAYVKGFRDFDVNLAWEAILKDAMVAPTGDSMNNWADRALWTSYEARGGLTWYKLMGYVPVDRTKESVSRTLEFAYDDFCIAQVAKGLGKNKEYDELMKRSKYYKNVYDSVTGFMLPRWSNGEFMNWKGKEGFTEGTKWTYLFCAMQDVPGLIQLMGGQQKFEKKLDENFDSSYYCHDNEPGHHYIYLYDYIGKPNKTADMIYKHTPINYRNTPDGLTGNDDCGQMSAWLIFTSMGFYPVCPGTDEYAMGVPLFDKVTLQINQPTSEDKHTLTIIRKNYSKENKYVQSVTIDGKKKDSLIFKHNELVNAREIVFLMGKN